MESPNKLNDLSLAALRRLFARLDAPQAASLVGEYHGSFVGPGWLRILWPPLLTVTGLGGWQGKRFDGQGGAINLVLRGGQIQTRFPMLLQARASHLDGKPGMLLSYRSDNPLPWPWIIDEVRRLDERTLLGMTAVNLGFLRKLAFPFTLQSPETPDGL